MTEPVLKLTNVTVRYDPSGKEILDNFCLEIHAGEKVALLGLNGSGKTTLLYTVAGLLRYKGDITVAGNHINKQHKNHIHDHAGFLFSIPDDQILFPKVIDDTAFGLLRKRIPRDIAFKKASSILERLGIGHLAESSPYHLSHGERQRVALSGAVIGDPQILLLDEPSASLDPLAKESFCRLFESFGMTVILATHDMELASRICDRFIVLHKGRIIHDCKNIEMVEDYWKKLD